MGNSQSSRRKFLLMGKTGAGKSSTANTLLQKEVFKQSTNAHACTKTVELHSLQYKEMFFDVVDTPGLMDTELDEVDNTKFTRGNMIEAMKICERGFHALLLIVSFLDGFKAEDKMTVKVLKEIFGRNILKNNCIVVMTHGDLFHRNVGADIDFMNWCKTQSGAFADLFRECNYRVVLCNNKGTTKQKQETIETILILQRQLYMYTSSEFGKFSLVRQRDRVLLNFFLDKLKKKLRHRISILQGDLNLMKDSAKVLKDDTEKVISAFGILTHNNNLNLTNLPVNGNSADSEINPTANFLQLTEKVTSTFQKYLEKEPKCSKQSEQYMEMNQILNSPLQSGLRILGIHMEKLKSPANVIEDMNFQIHYWISVIAEEAHGTRLLDDVMTEAEDLKKEVEKFQVNRALHFFAY
ncbi:GTPase IMAP family member 7-like [Physella acuta]|uniref:GTPase IMAP family member 7-like n=1 Tax=Physella acuta TaxID=109671 RepID=UPI0027DC3EEB|nr:GTPase IMAP family member 7-like [Physella acuta]